MVICLAGFIGRCISEHTLYRNWKIHIIYNYNIDTRLNFLTFINIKKNLSIINCTLSIINEHYKYHQLCTLSIINDWKSHRLPLEGRISISKSLHVSQYTYKASIIDLKKSKIKKAQTTINNYIMNIKEGDKPWISKSKIYQPINKGGLNCIELESFFQKYQA